MVPYRKSHISPNSKLFNYGELWAFILLVDQREFMDIGCNQLLRVAQLGWVAAF
jgi:hypothetical protein